MFLVGYSVERIRMHCAAILAALFGMFQHMPRLAPALAPCWSCADSLVACLRVSCSSMCPDGMPDGKTQKTPPNDRQGFYGVWVAVWGLVNGQEHCPPNNGHHHDCKADEGKGHSISSLSSNFWEANRKNKNPITAQKNKVCNCFKVA